MVSKLIKKIFSFSFFLIGVSIGIIIIFLTLLNNFNKKYENLIYQNVFIDNIDFSGKTKNDVVDFFAKKSKAFQNLKFSFILEDQPIATFTGSQIKLKIDGETAAERAYHIGRSDFFLSSLNQKFLSFLKLKKFLFISNINYDDYLIKNYLLAYKEQYDIPAKNALFEFKDGKVVNFRKEEEGREINIDSVIADFENNLEILKTNSKDLTIKIQKIIIKPEIALSSINNFGIEELIAQGQSDYTHSIPSRIHNLKLAASKFHGVLISPGKVLSFNETVGDISSLTGYQPAYVIKDGKTVLGDGGGVCQVSTTLFRAALNAGLPIIERTAHAYRVIYYENDMGPGFDATVFAPDVDLKIKNDTSSYILIQTSIDEKNNLLIFKLFGKKDNRKVEISKTTIWDIIPPPEARYQDDPTLKKGVVKQIDFSAWGAKALFTYKVYKNGKLIIDQKFLSIYRPWQAVYLVGTGE
ncbi:MAG: hypothetical protein Fur009_8450 [Candidatus Microgenomates bacterium]